MKKTFKKDNYSSWNIKLGPYRNFLRKRVNQPWDQVWSEICEANDSRTKNGRGVRKLFLQFVYLITELDEDQNLVVVNEYGEKHSEKVLNTGSFYVDTQGILRMYRKPKVRGQEKETKESPPKEKYFRYNCNRYKAP